MVRGLKMCISSEDIRSEDELAVWEILCDKCCEKAERLMKKRKVERLFDIPYQDYGFCPVCDTEIATYFASKGD